MSQTASLHFFRVLQTGRESIILVQCFIHYLDLGMATRGKYDVGLAQQLTCTTQILVGRTVVFKAVQINKWIISYTYSTHSWSVNAADSWVAKCWQLLWSWWQVEEMQNIRQLVGAHVQLPVADIMRPCGLPSHSYLILQISFVCGWIKR